MPEVFKQLDAYIQHHAAQISTYRRRTRTHRTARPVEAEDRTHVRNTRGADGCEHTATRPAASLASPRAMHLTSHRVSVHIAAYFPA